ncbi:MAG: tetratricopeptide repeat protein [Rhodothermales bacterium]
MTGPSTRPAPPNRDRWFVSRPLRMVLRIAMALAVFMLANTLYLLANRLAEQLGLTFFAAGDTSLPALFQAMVLSHTGVGLLVVVLMLVFGIGHLPQVWKRYKRPSGLTGIGFTVLGLILGITGLFILTSSASRDNSWAWWLHVVTAFAAPTAYVLHRLRSRSNRPSTQAHWRFGGAVATLLLVLVVWHGFTNREIVLTDEARLAMEQGLHTGPGARDRDAASFAGDGFVPAGYVPPESPFFPAATTTTSGSYLPSRIITRDDLGAEEQVRAEISTFGFVKDTPIGAETCQRCHADVVAQWEASAHRFASFNNPFYEATIEDMRKNATESNPWVDRHLASFPDIGADGVGRAKSKWCSGCHDPALMLAGKMNQPIDRNAPEAQAGLTCLACHAIDTIHDRTGNGNYNIADEQEDPYLFATARSGSIGALLHDAALKAKPTVHMRQLLKPVFKSAEYCATCHKVSLRAPLNNYRWLRGQNEYDNWHDSGVALNASRTFYLPPVKRVCQDCHMPLEPAPLGDVSAKGGMVKSHRFLAVNTALPFLRGDTDTIRRIEAFLRSEKLRVEVFAVSSASRSEPIMDAAGTLPPLPAGEQVTVDVVVRNQGVGHTFPGGTNDSNEGWLEFTVTDDAGITLAISGYIDATGHLDPMAHVFKAVMVDKNSRPIQMRNAQDIHTTVFANVIGPGTADLAHYTFRVPEELAGRKLTLKARLLWRKFDRPYTEFAYRTNPVGFKRFDAVPNLPITEIAAHQVTLPVVDAAEIAGIPFIPVSTAAADDPQAWIRFNDYGIGLLLENDTRGAARAFARVAELAPARVDGPLNLARTAFQDGNLTRAYQHLQACERIAVGDPRVAWVWGLVRQEDGLYGDAAAAYRYVLETFPEDRATWRQLGRTYYLDQQYEQSIEAYSEALAIDPEDREAYYHLMLNYRALGDEAQAALAEQAFEYYQIDESASEVARTYRLQNPGANLMVQDIRIHPLELTTGAP